LPLDPETQAIVDLIDTYFPRVGTEVFDAVEARRILKESPLEDLQGPEVAEVENRTIPGPAGAPDIAVRIYRPRVGADPLPLVVFFHGGGWTVCDLDTHDITCRNMANATDATVISVDYRLAPEHRFPAAAEDAYAATVWAHDHAAELGGDAARLAVAGDSAGGNLAAAVALMARDRGGPAITFQLLIYPVTDRDFTTASYRDNATGYFLTKTHMEWYWDQYIGDDDEAAVHPYAAPLRAATLTGLPPAHIVTAEYDPLRDEGEAYGRRLADAGVPVDVRRYDGMFHGFFSMEMLEASRQAGAEAHAALTKAFAAAPQ
jgi:acetyl esterase